MKKVLCAIVILVTLSSCGRYGPPLPPEMLAPEAVRDLKITALQEGVSFEWSTPLLDRRGEKLEEMSGYLLQRKTLEDSADLVSKNLRFETVMTVEDLSLKDLKERKKLAKEKGRVSRKVKADTELQRFNVSDTTVQNGINYIYRIVPINQGRVEGRSLEYAQVLFNGIDSLVSIISESELVSAEE